MYWGDAQTSHITGKLGLAVARVANGSSIILTAPARRPLTTSGILRIALRS
jgi:hypothetical protein